MDLITAVKQGLIVAQATGDGISSMQLSLSSTSKLNDDIDVTVAVGTIFKPTSPGPQCMVVTGPTDWPFQPYTVGPVSVSLSVSVACINMYLSTPMSWDTFGVQASASGDLLALLNLSDFKQASDRVSQFAIWTITDNPARDAFALINGFGPTDDEINQVRQLLEKAGIKTSNYAAFQ